MSAVTLIDSLPKFITPDEHRELTGTTPASFSDIPPVLRHKEETASVRFEPPVEGFTQEDGTKGTLYVIESALVFQSATGRAFQVPYPSITLHAVSRADTGPFIYCQLDEPTADNAPEAAEGEEEYAAMRELSIAVPSNSIEAIFEALSYCASLHPDPNMDDDMDDDAFVDDSNFETFNGDGDEELSEVGKAALAHLESIIYDPHNQLPEDGPEEQFQDAEESNDAKPAANGTH
ncbi:unnamed protein product [Peniophora sp. CBMAI 1063]|nr:unnamed protein product [Peniophora sp. CBMAI 1063]